MAPSVLAIVASPPSYRSTSSLVTSSRPPPFKEPAFPDPVYSSDQLYSGARRAESLDGSDLDSLPPYSYRPPSYRQDSCLSAHHRARDSATCGSPTCPCSLPISDLERQARCQADSSKPQSAQRGRVRTALCAAGCLLLVVGLVGIPIAISRLTMHPEHA